MAYVGRFAPSPSGPLHFGSLLAAVASYLDAKSKHGQWLLRIDDIDQPREVAGSSDAIKQALQAHGLAWDGPAIYQSQRNNLYHAALKQLQQSGLCYPCDCSRSRINGQAYDGHCRHQTLHTDQSSVYAIRIHSGEHAIYFDDLWQGRVSENINQQHGDFVIWRKDDICAYQLAVVVDDHAMDVNNVIRGQDLMASTPRQLRLYDALGLPKPKYGHFPLLVNPDHQKLSKQSYAPAINNTSAVSNLRHIIHYLGQTAAPLCADTPDAILQFAITHWNTHTLPKSNIVWQE